MLCTIQERVFGIVADTTASNFGRLNGSVVLLQVHLHLHLHLHLCTCTCTCTCTCKSQEMLGYKVLIVPCMHHVMELPLKHIMRLVSGRRTTGPGETIFIEYYNQQNEVREELAGLGPGGAGMRKFDWEMYQGAPLEQVANDALWWGIAALDTEEFSRGNYRSAG